MAGPAGGIPRIRTDLAYYGVVTQVISATQFVATGLAGLSDGAFVGYAAYVLAKADGTTTPPHAEQPAVTAYVSSSGTFTHVAYTATLSVGDQLLLLHPNLSTVIAPAIGRILCVMDFWSDLKEEVAVTGAQSTIALSPVTIANLPAGATIVRAIALFKFRVVENTFAGANRLDAAAALPIQVNDGAATGYVTAIDFVDDAFTLAASIREGGDIIIGDNNIATRVDGNDTYPFRWLNAKADQNNIQFNDVQTGLRVWYSI